MLVVNFYFLLYFAQMKNYVLGIAALTAVVLLAGCGNKELTPTEYCEQNGGVAQEGICLFEDGSYCGDEAYAKGECQPGEIIYNTVDEEIIAEEEVVAEEENAIEEEVAEAAEEVEVAGEEALNEAEEEVAEAEEEVAEVAEEAAE